MASNAEERVDLTQYWRILVRRRWLLMGPLAVVLVGAAVGSRLARPVYESGATILIQPRQPLSRSLEQLLLGDRNLASRERASALAERVRSPDHLRSVIDALGLASDPDLRLAAAQAMEDDPGGHSLDEIIERRLIGRLRGMIAVESRGANLFRISVRGEDPALVHRIARSLLHVMQERALQNELERASSIQQFSADQLALYQERLADAEERLTRYRKEIAARAIGGTVVDATNLSQASALVDQFESEIAALEAEIEDYSATVAALGQRLAADAGIETQTDEALRIARRLVPLFITASWMDPEVMHQSAELARTRDEIRQALTRAAAVEVATGEEEDAIACALAAVDLRVAEAKRATIRGLIYQYRESVVTAPEDDLTLARLEAEVERNREIYNTLLEQSGAAELSKAVGELEIGRSFEILVSPSLPLTPVSPDRKKALCLGALVGLVLGIVAVFVAEYADRSLKSIEEAEEYLELPVLGTIPPIEQSFDGRDRPFQILVVSWRHKMAEALVAEAHSKER